jgi:Tol biopolymer transport system component
VGEKILLTTYDAELYLYNSFTKSLMLALKGCCGKFAPDGKSIVYLQRRSSPFGPSGRRVNYDLWLMDLASGRRLALTSGGQAESWGTASWNPAGTLLALTKGLWRSMPGQSDMEQQLWVMNADGLSPKKIGDNASSPVWTVISDPLSK